MSLLNTKNLKPLLSFLLIIFCISSAFSQDAESPEVGMIKTLSGKVWLHREGKKNEVKKAMELRKGDVLEIEDQASATIVYFKDGKKEDYKSKALVEIGTDKSTIKEGSVTSIQESQYKKIIIDKRDEHPTPNDKDIAHAGGQFIRGILPPKQYFENNHIQRYAVVIGIS